MSSFELSQSSTSLPLWAFYAMAATTLLYLVFVRPMQRQKKDPLVRPPFTGGLAKQRAVERQMETLLVDLSEMSRQITGQLDTRAAKLEALIKEADEKIAALQGQISGRSARVDLPPSIGAASMGSGSMDRASSSGDAPETEPDSRHRDVYAMADAGMPAGQIAQRLGRPGGEVELILALRPRK